MRSRNEHVGRSWWQPSKPKPRRKIKPCRKTEKAAAILEELEPIVLSDDSVSEFEEALEYFRLCASADKDAYTLERAEADLAELDGNMEHALMYMEEARLRHRRERVQGFHERRAQFQELCKHLEEELKHRSSGVLTLVLIEARLELLELDILRAY